MNPHLEPSNTGTLHPNPGFTAGTKVRSGQVPIPPQESGRRGGKARAASLSPERRAEISRKAYIAGAVKRIAEQWPELTEDQRNTLRNLVAPVEGR